MSRQRRKPSKPTFIYFLRSTRTRILFKIGITANPEQRFKQLKVPAEATIIRCSRIRSPRKLETEVKRRYDSYRLPQSEWFHLDEPQSQEIIEWIDQKEKERETARNQRIASRREQQQTPQKILDGGFHTEAVENKRRQQNNEIEYRRKVAAREAAHQQHLEKELGRLKKAVSDSTQVRTKNMQAWDREVTSVEVERSQGRSTSSEKNTTKNARKPEAIATICSLIAWAAYATYILTSMDMIENRLEYQKHEAERARLVCEMMPIRKKLESLIPSKETQKVNYRAAELTKRIKNEIAELDKRVSSLNQKGNHPYLEDQGCTMGTQIYDRYIWPWGGDLSGNFFAIVSIRCSKPVVSLSAISKTTSREVFRQDYGLKVDSSSGIREKVSFVIPGRTLPSGGILLSLHPKCK